MPLEDLARVAGSPAARDVQAAFAYVLADEWSRAGVTDVVVAPGSRSTPLLVALAEAEERGELALHVHLDERAAGFFALGMALASGNPAVVVTTSGTAAVELHPSVVEADLSGVPLIAVTADRPEELHGCGAPQTVEQSGLFGGSTRWAVSVGVADLASAGWWRSLASRAVAEARGGAHRPGPVHLNMAFREPLLGAAGAVLGDGGTDGPGAGTKGRPALRSAGLGREDRAPWHSVVAADDLSAPAEMVRMLAEAGERGLIVAGAGGAGAEAVWQLSRATSWPVLANPVSGCRTAGSVTLADSLLRTSRVRQWRPDIVLRLGAPWASRVLNEWLAELECPQVLVDPWGSWSAPDRLPGFVVAAAPDALCLAVAKAVPAAPRGDWARQWALAESAGQAAVDATIGAEEGTSEPALARAVMAALPKGAALVLSSSMPVRDFEWWAGPRDGVTVLSNRGANGIDGVLSTALGVAVARTGRTAASEATGGGTVAVLGDLAFLYDAGALLRAGQRALRLDVVVVDNDGGGIFNFLPQAAEQDPERFERLWGTPHGTDLCAVASAYGVDAEQVGDLESLIPALSGPQGPGVRVWVVKTPRAANVTAHRRLHEAVELAVVGLG